MVLRFRAAREIVAEDGRLPIDDRGRPCLAATYLDECFVDARPTDDDHRGRGEIEPLDRDDRLDRELGGRRV